MKHKHEEQDTAIDGLTDCLLRVISGRSGQYHANVCFWVSTKPGLDYIADTQLHVNYKV